MSGHRPLTRSKSRKLIEDNCNHDGLESRYMPTPLNIQQPRVRSTSGRQRIDLKAIGLALGSPRESSLSPLPGEDPSYFNDFSFPASTNGRTRADTNESMGSKTKVSRWKPFSGFFHKKNGSASNEPQSLYSLDQTAHKAWQTFPDQARRRTRKRAGSDKEKGMDLHNVVANKQMARGPSILRRATAKRKAIRKSNPSQVGAENPRTQAAPGQNALAQIPPDIARGRGGKDEHSQFKGGFPVLRVEIPNVEMERYSVMFGNVLKAGLKPPSQISLHKLSPASIEGAESSVPPLEALQQPLRLDEIPRPHRRDGSASTSRSKSPSFSLFPSPQSSPTRGAVNKPLPRPSPLSRSVTAPDTKTTTPPRPPLKANKTQDLTQILPVPGKENIPVSKFTVHSRQSSLQSSHSRKLSFEPSPSSTTSYGHIAQLSLDNSHRPSSSHTRKPSFDPSLRSMSDSHGSFFDAPEVLSTAPPSTMRPLGPTATTSNNSKQAFLNLAFPARKSSLKRPEGAIIPVLATGDFPQQHPTSIISDLELPNPPYSSTNNATHSPADSMGSAAEVSVARQISFSRKQRQLLVPVVSKMARQPLVPQMGNVNGVDGGGRRSELVMLEEA
ncbi:MAG: hypothetical protein Q9217_001534 [Psora testacea]